MPWSLTNIGNWKIITFHGNEATAIGHSLDFLSPYFLSSVISSVNSFKELLLFKSSLLLPFNEASHFGRYCDENRFWAPHAWNTPSPTALAQLSCQGPQEAFFLCSFFHTALCSSPSVLLTFSWVSQSFVYMAQFLQWTVRFLN